MTQITRSKITSKLEYLQQIMAELAELQEIPAQVYRSNKRDQRAVERLLQIAIEAAIDIAQLIVIEQQLRKPREDYNVFVLLADKEIITATLAKQLQDANRFRNVLVHEYVVVDSHKVHQHLQSDLDDLSAFASIIASYIE